MQTALLDEGRQGEFLLPVDSECKALVFRPWNVRGVHMRAFHASWLSFFVSFFATFAPAALSVTIRDELDLKDRDISNADIAAVAGTVFSRLVLGSVCDTFGPRVAHSILLLTTSVACFCFAIVNSPTGYVLCRLTVGLSLGTFVACQYWSSVIFNVRIVGRANAVGAGAGASGGGVSQFVMPAVLVLLSNVVEPFVAWRVALLLPGVMQVLVAVFILTSTQDLPDGSFVDLLKRGSMKKSSTSRTWWMALRNYRVWLATFSYGLVFGIDLALENILTRYFFDNFGLDLTIAGVLGSLFGTLNVVARPLSGYISDVVAVTFGMRGRLVYLLFTMLFGSCFVVALALCKNSLVLSCVVIVFMALGIEGSQAGLFSIVPFISKRSLGVVNGMVGAGGNLGAAIFAWVFFDQNRFDTTEGIQWAGIILIVFCVHMFFYYFPMWGGICCEPTEGAEETDYYLAEYTRDEIIQGKADRSVLFASNARSQRSQKFNSRSSR